MEKFFGNTLITQPNGEMLGLEGESTFFTWARNGVFTIQDIWYDVNEDWMNVAQLKTITRSRSVPIQRAAILASLKWKPDNPTPPTIGDRVTYDVRTEIKHVYVILEEIGMRFIGIQYLTLPTEELKRSEQPQGRMPERTLEQVRIIITTGIKNTVQCYNPTLPRDAMKEHGYLVKYR